MQVRSGELWQKFGSQTERMALLEVQLLARSPSRSAPVRPGPHHLPQLSFGVSLAARGQLRELHTIHIT